MPFISSRYLFLSAVCFVLLLGTAQTVTACSCGPSRTVLDEFDFADEVVIAKVIFVERAKDTQEHYYVDGVRSTTVVIEKVFKGKLKVRDEIVFAQGSGANCIWTFNHESIGHEYLFYLRRPESLAASDYRAATEPGLWFASDCERSTGLADATEDLLYLENMPKLRGKTRVSGAIDGWRNPDINVEGKRIRIIGAKKTYTTKTDKDGVFEIYDLPPGKYFIEPEMPPGWKLDDAWFRYSPSVITNDYGRPELKGATQVAITLEPRKHAGVYIAFKADNFVRGRVIGPRGKPLSGVCVYLLQREEGDWGPSDCTDEQGRFQIASVPKGEYILGANPDDKPSGREPFRKIFYPSVSERERATVISIGFGETVENIDLLIPQLEETIVITGVLRYSDGEPAVEKWVTFKPTKGADTVHGEVSEQTGSAGRFTLRVLKGLTGELASEAWLSTGLYKNCPKVDELLAKSGKNTITVDSNVMKFTADENLYDVELTLPFPRCEKAKE